MPAIRAAVMRSVAYLPMDEKITALARLVKRDIVAWTFVPTGVVIVNDIAPGAHVGEVFFHDNHLQTNAALQAGDWAFCLVRTIDDPSPENEWVMAGFHGHDLCFFDKVIGQQDPREPFALAVVDNFWPIIYPDNPCHLTPGEKFRINFKLIFANRDDIIAMQRHRLSGGGPPTM